MQEHTIEALCRQVLRRICVEMEASGRHVHLTKEQAHQLFGHGLTPDRPLSQPGQFVCKERVAIVGPKGEFKNVAVLGPERSEGQVEISLTDGKTLGIKPPVRLSGQVKDTPGITIRSEKGEIILERGVIAAQRHIHMTPEDAARFGVEEGQVVRLETYTDRPVIFGDTVVRVSKDFSTRVHLDYDEANACGFAPGDLGRIRL